MLRLLYILLHILYFYILYIVYCILSLQVNDLVKLGFLILMIRTYYYLIGTYFYYLLLGPCGWHGVFNQLRSIFWLVFVSILMALSCIMKSCLVIYDISCVYDCIWQLYMRAIFPNNPARNNLNFRRSTSLYLPNIRFVVYYWVPRTILLLGIQGRNHHERMAYEMSRAQYC